MNTKILASMLLIGAVALAIGGGATGAFFSDTETSTGNTFAAGAIDLTVDSQQHYNGNVCQLVGSTGQQTYQWVGNAPYPKAGTSCDGTWTATNLGAEHKFFNFNDVKPGDSGEDTISLHVDSNDAWVRLLIKDVTDLDNTCTEPEGKSEMKGGNGNEVGCDAVGELRQNLLFSVFADAVAIM